jgi:hypothetical protein
MCESTSDNAFGFHSDFVTRTGHEFYYAVIPGLDDNCIRNSCPGGGCTLKLTQTQEQRLTQVTSHEFAEMITDPKFTQGWYGTSSDENGDICVGESATITVGPNTWTVQRQYSKIDDENSNGTNFCVVSAPNPMALRADGPPPVGDVNPANLLFKDGEVLRWLGSPDQWERIGNDSRIVSMAAASGYALYLLFNDGEVLRWLGSPDQWERIGNDSRVVAIYV